MGDIMKKLLAALTCIILIFTFTACGGKKKSNNDAVDLQYYAKIGQIPEMPYKLGAKCDKVTSELQAEYDAFLANDPHNSADHDHDHYAEEVYFNVSDKDGTVFLDNGSKYYYYKTAEKKNGISCIVTFGDAFGFKMGTFIYELKIAMPSIEFEEEEITEGSIFFADYLTSGTTLTAELDGVSIMFIFQESELYATAMYKTDSWK